VIDRRAIQGAGAAAPNREQFRYRGFGPSVLPYAFQPFPQGLSNGVGHCLAGFLGEGLRQVVSFRVFDVQGHDLLLGRILSTFLYNDT
jgi:hypothetical protein